MKFCKVPLAAVEVWGQQLQNGGWGASSSLTSHTKLSSQTEVQPICLGRYLAPYLLKIQAFLSSTHLDTDNKLLASAGCCVAQQPSFSGRVAPLLLADSASLFPGVPAAGWPGLAGLGWAGLGWLGWAGWADQLRQNRLCHHAPAASSQAVPGSARLSWEAPAFNQQPATQGSRSRY